MSKAPERYVIGAVQPKNALRFPTHSVSRLWEDRLFPLKAKLTRQFGVGLFGLVIKQYVDTTLHRNFEIICREHGLYPPLNARTRVIVSDTGFERAPGLGSDDHLLVAINADDREAEVWRALEGRSDVLEIGSRVSSVHGHLCDIFLDIAFANTYWGRVYTRQAARLLGGKREFYRAKAASAHMAKYVHAGAPYLSFSRVARDAVMNGGKVSSPAADFGSDLHIQRFVSLWDSFLLGVIKEGPKDRDGVIDLICKYPKIGGMMARKAVRQVVDDLAPGVHVLIVERRSLKIRSNPKFRNEVEAAFSSLPILGAGGKMWGIWNGALLPDELARLVDTRAAYAIRIIIGK